MPKTQNVSLKKASKRVAFDGSAGNGAVGTVELFNVTGKVLVLAYVAYCSTDLAGALAKVKVGTVGFPALISQGAVTATDVHAGDIWGGFASVPLADGVTVDDIQRTGPYAILNDDIVFTIEVAPVTGGVVMAEIIYAEMFDGGAANAA